MKLHHHNSTSLLSNYIIYINIILLHIALIHSLTPKSERNNQQNNNNNNNNNNQKQSFPQTTTPLIINNQHQHDNDNNNFQQHQDANQYQQQQQLSAEHREVIMKKLKSNLLKALGLKEAPQKPHQKAHVPREMLERYSQFRESVRETIPNDKDFYGKLHIDSADHEDFWTAVNNKFGSYDIEVDMTSSHKLPQMLSYNGEAKQIRCIGPEGEPQDIHPSQEHLLLPNYSQNQQFYSVLLKFNLSDGQFIDQLNINDVRAAELHLSREKISHCQNGHCSTTTTKKPPTTIFDNKNDYDDKLIPNNPDINQPDSITDRIKPHKLSSINKNSSEVANSTILRNRPRYQKVYILQVLGYDSHGDIMTRVHHSLSINTYDTTTLKIDISNILKDWLSNPAKNYGLIVRVTNDDDEYHERINVNNKLKFATSHQTNASQSLNGNVSPENANYERFDLTEHVRLKRDFRWGDEKDEVWIAKRPMVMIFSDTPEITRSHVKREDTESAQETSMQADEPEVSVANSNNFGHPNSHTNDDNNENNRDAQTKPNNASTKPTSTNRNNNKTNTGTRRDNNKNGNGNRNTAARVTSPASGQSQRGSRGRGKPPRTEKCSKKTLSINFDEVGWSSWIIAPQAYYADYCVGDCSFPMSDQQNATNHAIIQSIYHVVGRPVPRSCCAPTKLSKMAILYQIDGGVQMKQYDDMIVESCGCL